MLLILHNSTKDGQPKKEEKIQALLISKSTIYLPGETIHNQKRKAFCTGII